jgi:hypothetical protein
MKAFSAQVTELLNAPCVTYTGALGSQYIDTIDVIIVLAP